MNLRWRIEGEPRYRLGLAVEVEFSLENHSSELLWALIWATPLEGLFSECLLLEQEGCRLPYRGPLVKRGNPTADQYLFLGAGEKLCRRLDLSQAYAFERSGEVHLRIEAPLADAVREGETFPRDRPFHRSLAVRPAEFWFGMGG